MRTCLYIHTLFTHVLRENTKPPLFSPLTRGLQGHPNFLSSIATKGKNTEPNVTVSHYCLGMEVKSHTHTIKSHMSKAKTTRLHAQTHNKQWWAFAAGWTQGTSERIVPTAPRQLLHQHTYTGRAVGVASVLVIASSVCIVSCHLSSLIIYFSWLTHVFTDILHIKLLLKLSQPLLVFFSLTVYEYDAPSMCRDALPEAPAAVKTCPGINYSSYRAVQQ